MAIAAFDVGPRANAAYIPVAGRTSLEPVRLDCAGEASDADDLDVRRAIRQAIKTQYDFERRPVDVSRNTSTTGSPTSANSGAGDYPASQSITLEILEPSIVCYLRSAPERLILSKFIDSILDPPRI